MMDYTRTMDLFVKKFSLSKISVHAQNMKSLYIALALSKSEIFLDLKDNTLFCLIRILNLKRKQISSHPSVIQFYIFSP